MVFTSTPLAEEGQEPVAGKEEEEGNAWRPTWSQVVSSTAAMRLREKKQLMKRSPPRSPRRRPRRSMTRTRRRARARRSSSSQTPSAESRPRPTGPWRRRPRARLQAELTEDVKKLIMISPRTRAYKTEMARAWPSRLLTRRRLHQRADRRQSQCPRPAASARRRRYPSSTAC